MVDKIGEDRSLIYRIFLLVVFISFYFSCEIKNSEDLYYEYFEPYPNVIKDLVYDASENELLEIEAFMAYERENYALASQKFVEIDEIDDDLYIDFYLANTYMAMEQFNNAEPIFKFLLNNKKAYYNESLWYLSLIQLKKGHERQVINRLRELVEIGTYQKKNAEKLLKNLNP